VPCTLNYIPQRLLPNGRQNLPTFELGERLYRRCKNEAELTDPFSNISLVDISVNRSGFNNCLSVLSDVLYNTHPKEGLTNEIFDLPVAELMIEQLDEVGKYVKEFEGSKLDANNQSTSIKVRLELKHKLHECNYPHCAFEFHYNGIEVTMANYKETLGHKSGGVQKIRTLCKHELSRIILGRILRIHW